MMDTPLLLSSFIERAENYFPNKLIISRTNEDKIHRISYKLFAERTRKLSNALTQLGMKAGVKVGSFAWNHHRHLELYFGVPSAGAVLHMINIRLSDEHLVHIVNHAEDEILVVDDNLFPIIDKLLPQMPTVKHVVIMSDSDLLPESDFASLHDYESLLAQASSHYDYPELDQDTPAGLCYTSATTGKPKGVMYSHRALVLHSFSLGTDASIGLNEADIAMPVVPMFHVNAWGIPFASVLYGTTQVLPGPNFTPEILLDLIEEENVTLTAGVPTIFIALLREQQTNPRKLDSLRLVVAGGAASPKGLIKSYQDELKVPYIVGYGMTETTPVVSVSRFTSEIEANYSDEEKLELRATQGLTVPGIQSRIVNEDGDVPWDGKTMGDLMFKGPWIADEYYKDDRTEDAFKDGWLITGDIAVYTKEGYIKITDRSGDLIKSGGEWISSVDLENAIMSLPEVFEAAVVAVPHPKWQERPVACVVVNENIPESEATKDLIIHALEKTFARWSLPDDVIFMKELPKTSVGKFLKRDLRVIVREKMGIDN